ncbi:jg4950 [Pararge aegeria aegeria]|uniref:Jg4950 protein n=1 Tax=Pararge aegeria aegeria TaxID=348720 RepID=A0A8S4SH12_9NEOP|nr:jg4950 [Pararge aegeria aegeria]
MNRRLYQPSYPLRMQTSGVVSNDMHAICFIGKIPGQQRCRTDTYCARQFENGTYFDNPTVPNALNALNHLALCQWSDNDQTLITHPKHTTGIIPVLERKAFKCIVLECHLNVTS